MTIDLYLNNSENNAVLKNITQIISMKGDLRQGTSIINPTIDFQYETTISPKFNYVYIPDFRRYYFLKNLTSVRNNLWRMDLHVDVLMSFKEEILANTATISRQENLWNMYLNDGTFRAYSNPIIQFKKFPNDNLLNNDNLVLIVAGGIGN